MPTEARPLFRVEAIRPHLAVCSWPDGIEAAREKLRHWAALLASKRAETLKETELLPDFIGHVFCDLLGYTGPAGGSANYTLRREALVEVDGKRGDAALGRFSVDSDAAEYVAILEGKGPRDPLDRPFADGSAGIALRHAR